MKIEIENRKLKFEVIMLPLKKLNVIAGMKWLSKYQAQIDYNNKRISLCINGEVFHFLVLRVFIFVDLDIVSR